MIKRGSSVTGLAKGIARPSKLIAWSDYENQTVSRYNQVTFGHPGPPYRESGPWLYEHTFDTRTNFSASSPFMEGTGMLGSASFTLPASESPRLLTEGESIALGTSFFNSALQSNAPRADVPVFLGELIRDGVPSMIGVNAWKEKTNLARAAGSEYLNTEFGWKPFVSDLKSFAHVVTSSDKIWRNYVERANSWNRVSRSLPTEESWQTASGQFAVIPSAVNLFAVGSTSEVKMSRTWFVGHFKYHVPVAGGIRNDMNRFRSKARLLTGLRLTPDVVWNLAPWSWAADWFGNFGTVMSNVSLLGQDGLVARDANLMRELRIEKIHTGTIKANTKGIPTATLTTRSGYIAKTRKNASPFGFGVSWGDLTPRQIAISLAIGASQGGSAYSK